MEILIVQETRVAITPQALVIYPFKNIWADNEEGVAIQKLSFIEFMCSHKKSNPFVGYEEEANDPARRRDINICNSISPNGTGEELLQLMKEDELVTIAIQVYRKLESEESVSLEFYEASVAAARKMIDFFTTFDLSEVNDKGYLLYKPADITRALKDSSEILKILGGLKDKVAQELFESAKGKAGREINHFEKAPSER